MQPYRPEYASMASKDSDQTDVENRTALIDSRTNYRRKRQPETSSKHESCLPRCWIFLTVVFFCSTVALLAVLFWREFWRERRETVRAELQIRYPGYFRTMEEQAEYVRLISAIVEKPVNKTEISPFSCKINCYNTTKRFLENIQPTTKPPQTTTIYTTSAPVVNTTLFDNSSKITYPTNKPVVSQFSRKRRAISGAKYHGCCISSTSFIAPVNLVNVLGNERTIAQFDNMKQYFKQENCRQAENCHGCQCTNIMDIITAVIEKDNVSSEAEDPYDIDWFEIIGCCKCHNLATTRR